jgi:AcrR family transcriptional regulator
MTWLGEERGKLAPERILDAAGDLFAERGVGPVGMGEIAKAAGCSRATLYRYFADREELHTAFVHREARRVGGEVATAVAGIDDPTRLVTEAVLVAVRRVRETPTLAAWFAEGDAARTAALAQPSAVIEALGMSVVDDPDDARWLVRVILSLLTVPGRDDEDERAMVERYVAPRVTSAP